jgi:hypothetical protein
MSAEEMTADLASGDAYKRFIIQRETWYYTTRLPGSNVVEELGLGIDYIHEAPMASGRSAGSDSEPATSPRRSKYSAMHGTRSASPGSPMSLNRWARTSASGEAITSSSDYGCGDHAGLSLKSADVLLEECARLAGDCQVMDPRPSTKQQRGGEVGRTSVGRKKQA